MTHNNVNYACLLSLQFQIAGKKLIMIANFRSHCKINGKPNVGKMVKYFATQVTGGTQPETGLKVKRNTCPV